MKKIIILLIVLALACGAWYGWKSTRTSKDVRILASEKVQRGPVRKVLEETGIIKSQVGGIVKIGARSTGIVNRMLVKVGDPVAKGDLVARIDNRELHAQAEEARAAFQSQQAELERVKKVNPLRVSEAEAQVELSRARSAYSDANYLRLKSLAEDRIISTDELEQAHRQALMDASQLRADEASLARERGETAEQLIKAQFGVQQAQAALSALDVRISYTNVVSPLTGVVSQVTAQEGETVVAGLQVANLVTVIDPTRLEMWIYVDETDVGLARPGQTVEFRVDAHPGRIFTGEIAVIYPEPEIRDNIVYYRALVSIARDQVEQLRPEMTTQVQIVVEEKPEVLRIPNSALKWVEGKQVVFVRDPEGPVRQLSPKLGLAGMPWTEVVEGLSEGQEVATQVDLPQQAAKRKKP